MNPSKLINEQSQTLIDCIYHTYPDIPPELLSMIHSNTQHKIQHLDQIYRIQLKLK